MMSTIRRSTGNVIIIIGANATIEPLLGLSTASNCIEFGSIQG